MLDNLGTWAAEGRFLAVALGAAGVVVFGVFGTVLAVIDARTHRLPRRWVHPMYPALVLLCGGAAVAAGRTADLLGGFCGAVAFAVLFGLMRLASPRSIGLGDLRLAPVLGWVLGLVSAAHALMGLVAVFVTAGLWAAVLVVTRRAGARSHIALGPWMIVGTAVTWLGSPASLL